MLITPAQAGTFSGPPSIDGIGETADPHGYWRRADLERREKSDWAAARLASNAAA
jgi:hypothetical protein